MNSQVQLLENLTAPQQEAVTHIDGPILVLAGPGSGKTRVITHRVAYLIEQGVAPWQILALTFTNKAAEEMRHRLAAMQPRRGTLICTFHALAVRLLREFAEHVGLDRNFSIFDDADQRRTLRQALIACDLDSDNFPPARMLARISNLKNDLVTPQDFARREGKDYMEEALARIYSAYQKQLAACVAVDFDDLLMKLAFLLRDHPALRATLNDRFHYLLVDEYQDTNSCQYQIAHGLSLSHSNLFVTGDPDQSIYGWRGADIGNILAFEEDFPQAKVVALEENFRSTPQVLFVADQLIAQNTRRKEKRLFTHKPSGPLPSLSEYYDEFDEAAAMVEWIDAHRREGLHFRQMAVFYRVNAMSRVLETALRGKAIPYQIVRGVEFFQRAEIKNMIAYLRFMVNPDDQIALARIINQPRRGIGDTTVKRLIAATEFGKGIGQVLADVNDLSILNAGAKAKIAKFAQLMDALRALQDKPVREIMEAVYTRSGLRDALQVEDDPDHRENVEELINSAAQYDDESPDGSLTDYLQLLALSSDTDAYDADAGAVSLMTLHAAKGLEFPAVLIAGLEEGLIPHARHTDSADGLEEERRLLFVGITRAEQTLAMTTARNRTVHGASQATIQSQFLHGLQGIEFTTGSRQEHTFHDDPWQDDAYTGHDMEEFEGLRTGLLIRHTKWGLGRIQSLIPAGQNSKAIVKFNTGQQKTLVLKYAKLEIVK